MASTIAEHSPAAHRNMRLRKLSEKTQSHYIRAVRRLAAFLGRSPDIATAEDLRNFQLHRVDHGVSPISLNAAITGLKVFFDVILDRGQLMARTQPVRLPKTLPVVLSREEVSRLIAAARNLKHQTALSMAYATGLRASEVFVLRVGDIDSQRMTLRVEQGKMLDGGWPSPGLNPIDHLRTRQLNRAIHLAETAQIDTWVSLHTLRHSFATHLLEQKVDIR